MNLGLEGKIVLVTGGGKGIGLACAQALAGEGAGVAIASRSAENLERASEVLSRQGVEVLAVAVDLRVAEEASKMAAEVEKRLGQIDVLVNSDGGATPTVV